LLQRFRRGQNGGPTLLFLRYAERVHALASAQFSPGLAARITPDDIVQSVFRTFFRRAAGGQYDVPEGEEIWKLLLVIALHKIRDAGDYHRAARRDVRQTVDGGYVVLAETTSSNLPGLTNHGASDVWAVRFSSTGAILWNQLYGGSGVEHARAIQSLANGKYAFLADTTASGGDVAGTFQGVSDIWVVGLTAAATPSVVQVPTGTALPTDTNGDGLYDDVNGNGRGDFNDVVVYFNEMSWISANEPMALFDYNGNGRIDFADVVWLFNNL
jgi:PKD repeat protein